jgi:hypothetical protein
MSKNDSAQTIPGGYFLMTMPDGQQVMMSKLSNGEWVTTEERIRREEEAKKIKEFDQRFAGTSTIPDNYIKRDTETLEPCPDKMIATAKGSRDRAEAYLVEMLGDADAILAGEVEIKTIKEPRIKEHICGMIKVVNSPKWNRVAEKIWK